MKLDDLSGQMIPERVLTRWIERQGERLLPVQQKAIRKGLLKDQKDKKPLSMLISAPTSSGKSFCAEMAMIGALGRREKTVFLFPLKSLAEQAYRTMSQTYHDLGIKIVIATGDHPENDRAFKRGDYQVAIAIYEKFDLMLTESLDRLANIGLIVIDEIQTIADHSRGPILERLLTKVLASVYQPSLLALSAVIGDADNAAGRLADWLGAELVEEHSRPVDLIRGIAAEGSFRYRSYNDSREGEESFVKVECGDDPFDKFVEQLKVDGGHTLIFLKSRAETVERAFRLAAAVDWPEATQALKRLKGEEPSFLIRSLRQALGRGVAFHNSDLSAYQRQVIEEAFIEGEIRAIFSTTTLAMGVNLPADTVYLETVKYARGAYDSRPTLIPVSLSEFDNMTGRSGRLGLTEPTKPGRAIILAESDFDREILWNNYLKPESSDTVESALLDSSLESFLLNIVAAIGSADDIKPFMARTFYVHTGHSISEVAIAKALDSLTESGFITELPSGQKGATPLGRAIALSGLEVSQASWFAEQLSHGYPESFVGWLALALSAPDYDLPPGILSAYEQRNNLPLKQLYQSFDQHISAVAPLIDSEPSPRPLDYRRAASLKACLLLNEWSQLMPVERLEERYQIHLGQIINLGETAAHLISSLSTIIMAKEGQTALAAKLHDYAFSIRFGLPVEAKSLSRYFGSVWNRSDFAHVLKAKVASPIGLFELADPVLAALIKDQARLQQTKNILNQLKEEVPMDTRTSSAAVNNHRPNLAPITSPDSVEIDGRLEGERYLVNVNGFPVKLTGKSFKYFVKLAWSRLHRDSGWVYKEDIEIGFNQARYLYRMKNEVAAGLNFSWSMIENNRLGYYRLNVDPSRITINLENLKNHPDFEIRDLIKSGDGQTIH